MSIVVSNLSYVFQDGTSIISNINFSINSKTKCALIGANGCGKSSLINLLAGNIMPTEGSISMDDSPYLVPQHYGQYNDFTVSETLGVNSKMTALAAILSGDSSEINYEIIGDNWTIEDDIRNALNSWGLKNVRHNSLIKCLSGGEKTKVFLAGILLHNPSIILMDEPTNHLDEESRHLLYDFIDNYNGTLLVVSHDRSLLNRFSTIFELSDKGISRYTMNFEKYCETVDNENRVLIERTDAIKKDLRKEKAIAREVAERQQKQNSRGQRHSQQKGIARISMGNLKNHAENSTAKLNNTHQNKIESLTNRLSEATSRVKDLNRMAVDFSSSDIHIGKILIETKCLNHSYSGNDNIWHSDLSFVIRSGDRIRVTGSNGSGKSSLMKIIMGDLTPSCGSIYRAGDLKCVYLDQEYSLIDNGITISEQIQQFNNHSLPKHELNIRLNRFLFPESSWMKPCSALSGGEKMRLALCCLMVADNAPDMIIADEPTNNLDLFNQDILTDTLRKYSGTLIVISHDSHFVSKLLLNRQISL